jgi:hypothetical protein
MPTSEARIKANRANSLKSSGPISAEGKRRSRQNGLKHGMTGQGIVIPEGDLAEVESRKAALQEELAPESVIGAILVGQMATLSVRMERGATQEFAAVARRVRHASEEFDAERFERAEQLFKTIGDDLRGNLRQLLKSPEGVAFMVDAWRGMRANLTHESRPFWTQEDLATAANLLGMRIEQVKGTRLDALSRAVWCDPFGLTDQERSTMERDAIKGWAIARLVERVDAEIAKLEAHRETLDFETIEEDRAEAGARALFDPSKEASLARRYESEARRGFFKALKEFRQVEAEAAEQAASADSASASTDPLASCREEAPPAPDVADDDPVERVADVSRPVSKAISDQPEVDRAKRARALRRGRAYAVSA